MELPCRGASTRLKPRPAILGFGFVLAARGCSRTQVRSAPVLAKASPKAQTCWAGRALAISQRPNYLLALTRPRRVRFFALFLAVLRAERLRSVLRGFLTGRYMGARDLG